MKNCSSDNDDNPVPESGASGELVGQWYSDVSGATYAAWTYGKAWQQMEFNADGTGTTSIYYLNNDAAVGRERYSFTYTAKEGVLTMDIAERNTKTTARYTVSDGKLTMTEGDHQLAMQKMDDAKAKDFDAWNRKDNLVNVPQPARYTVFVYGNAGGTMDAIIEYGFWEKIQPLLKDPGNVRVVCFYKYGKKPSDEKNSYPGKYADPGDIVWFDLNDTTNLENIRNGGLQAYGYEKEAQAMKLCDPKTVSAFIQISSLVCPAEQYVFSIWGHGNGLNPLNDVPGKYEDPAAAPATRGVIGDEWNEGEQLDMYELSAAIRSAGLNRLNTIFFHNCLMGNMETLTELRGLYRCLSACIRHGNSHITVLMTKTMGVRQSTGKMVTTSSSAPPSSMPSSVPPSASPTDSSLSTPRRRRPLTRPPGRCIGSTHPIRLSS